MKLYGCTGCTRLYSLSHTYSAVHSPLKNPPRSRATANRSYSTIGINIFSGRSGSSTHKSHHSFTKRNCKPLDAKEQGAVEPVLNEHNRATGRPFPLSRTVILTLSEATAQ